MKVYVLISPCDDTRAEGLDFLVRAPTPTSAQVLAQCGLRSFEPLL